MALSREIDDVARVCKIARSEHKHASRLYLAEPTCFSVGVKIGGVGIFKLQRDAAPHYAYAIDGVHDRFCVYAQNVAYAFLDHTDPSVVPVWPDFHRWSMVGVMQDVCHLLRYSLIVNGDPANPCPRERSLNKKLRLFALFGVRIPELPRFHGAPIHLVKGVYARTKLRVCSAGIGKRDCPASTASVCRSNNFSQISLQMYNWLLPVPIGQARIIGAMNHIKHDRSRTKIERHVVAYPVPWPALHREIQPITLDLFHSDRGAG